LSAFTNLFSARCDAEAGNPNGGNVYLGLHPGSGDLLPGRIEFALRPTMVVIEIARMVPTPFILRVTDSMGHMNDFPFAPTSQHFFVGFGASHGIAQIAHTWKQDNGRFKFTALYLDETSLAAPGPLTASLTWTDRATLSWGDNSHNETAFIIERRAADEFQYRQIGRVDANVTTFVDSNIVSGYTYMYQVIATNHSGDFGYSDGIVVHTPFDHVFTSQGAQDGFVAELNEHAGFGWFVFPYNAGPAALRAGDTGLNQQCKAVTAFNTRSLPNGSIITGARLRLKRGALYGNPFGQLGNCYVDIAPASGFTRSLLLQPSDFQALPAKARIGLLTPEGPDSDWYVANLDAKIFGYLIQNNINQFRIAFERADNNDLAPDYIGWFSGENATPENRPRLEVLTDSTPPAN
jgi:hypothetical protein